MDRRRFLCALAGSALLPRWTWAGDLPRDLRITRIVGLDLVSVRPKLVGKNARRGVHGDRATDRMVRLFTNAGIEGLGACRAGRDALARLLGKDPLASFRRAERRMESPLGAGTMPLWDLAGKALGKPVHALLGAAGPERVPVYDGSIYFSDLLPAHVGRFLDRFREEIDMGLRRGHRAFKVKIGRGAKWMPAEEGYARDVAVLKAIRKHVGPGVVLGADANDGYDPARARRLLEDIADLRLAFLEEPFPETVEECLALKRFIARHGWETLLADGETQGRLEAYRPFMAARAIDIFQGDMNRFGIEGILTEAARAGECGLRVAPHNWGSLLGFYAQLHVGRAIPNFYRAEHDPLETPALVAEGYAIRDGTAAIPAAPGFGLRIREEALAGSARIGFDLKS